MGSSGANASGPQHKEGPQEAIFVLSPVLQIGSDKNSLLPDTVIVLILVIGTIGKLSGINGFPKS